MQSVVPAPARRVVAPYVEGANNGCRTCPHSTGEIFEYQQAMTLLWLAFFLFYGSNAFMNVVIRVKFDGYSLKKEGKNGFS